MKRSIKWGIYTLCVCICMSAMLYAGSYDGQDVQVTRENSTTWKGEASGTLSQVVASPIYGYIGCGLKVLNSQLAVQCNARDGNGVFIVGQSSSQYIIAAAQAISEHSFIHFWVDDNGYITRLEVINSSQHIYQP